MKAAVAAGVLLLLGIMAAGCGERARTGTVGSTRPTLHTVTLPALPKWVHRKFRALCQEGGCAENGVGVDANGDILVDVEEADDCCYVYGLVRFDPLRGRWVHGGIVNPTVPGPCDTGCLAAVTTFLPVGRAVWMIDENSGSVYRGRFSQGWTTAMEVVRASGCMSGPPPPCPPTRTWGVVNVLTPGPHGRVWVVGSTDPSCTEAVSPPPYVCGRSIVGLAGPRSRHIRAIPVSRSGTASDATVGPGGSLWLLVPRFQHCRHASCGRWALIRYDPTSRRLTLHTISARLWPDLAKAYYDRYVYAQRRSVLVVAVVSRGFRVIRLHHGSFTSRVVRLRGLTGQFRPPMDRNGDLWVCNSTRHTLTMVDPRTGRSRILRNRRGTSLLEDKHGRFWFVKGDPSDLSTC